MWCGRGIWFPLTHGWRGGEMTGATSGCAYTEHVVSSLDAVRVFTRPAEIQSPNGRITRTDLNHQPLFPFEDAMPQNALARGPPADPPAFFLENGFAQICCNDKEM